VDATVGRAGDTRGAGGRGRPKRRGAGLPALVVQGGRDPFGRPEEFPPGTDVAEVPYGDHGFAVPKSADVSQDDAMTFLTGAVVRWLDGLSF